MKENEIVTQAFIAKELFGVDPGRSNGGVVRFKDNRYECTPIKKMNTFESMCDFWKYQAEICELPLIFLEKINLYAGDFEDRGRMFQMKKLQDHYVELKSAIKSSGIKFIEVMPISWQSYLKVHIKNEESAIRKRRFKDIAKYWFEGQNVVGWNADAFLILDFGRRKLKYDPKWILNKLKENKPINQKLWKTQ